MSLAATRRAPALESEELGMLMHQLQTHAGISIDSTDNVVAHCIAQRMEYLGVADVASYMSIFDNSMDARAEWLSLMDLLTVKETRFFRQPEAFECMADYVQDLLSSGPVPKELSFWSAGCSYGQELFSMAMVMERVASQHSPWLEWHGIGTDISFEAINRAATGIYEERTLGSLPLRYRSHYTQQKFGSRVKMADDILSRTHFFHSNLLHVDSAPFADFNIISCQNVLIYFPREKQRWIIDQLVNRLRVGGLLILGAGEDAGWLNANVRRLKRPGVCAYKKIGG